MKKILSAVLLLTCVVSVRAENIYWQLGGLSFQVPSSGTDIIPVIGYDFRFKQGIGGLQTSLLNVYKTVDFEVGGVGVVPASNNGQPYLALSTDLKQFIKPLAQLSDLRINIATRYNTDVGDSQFTNHLGAIASVAYSWGGSAK